MEKKKRQHGKHLHLDGTDGSGPQFYNPSKIQAAREFQAAKAAQEDAEKAAISSGVALGCLSSNLFGKEIVLEEILLEIKK
jgi:hypothetical protein